MVSLDSLVVERIESDREGSRSTLHIWRPGEDLPKAVWKSEALPLRGQGGRAISQRYAGVTSTLLSKSMLYVGTENGDVDIVSVTTGRVVEKHSRFPKLSSFRPDSQEFYAAQNLLLGHFRDIRGLVRHNGSVYDASFAGLFETVSDTRVDPRMISSVGVYGNKLCMVPAGHSIEENKSGSGTMESKAGDLVEMGNGKTVMANITPFDGSGCSPGEYFVHGNKVFIRHGNWPDEKISIRSFPEGALLNKVRIPTSYQFVEHDGGVYDHRMYCPQDGDRTTAVMRSELEQEMPGAIVFTPSGGYAIASIASGGEHGLLVSLHKRENNKSRVVSVGKPRDPLFEGTGELILYKGLDK